MKMHPFDFKRTMLIGLVAVLLAASIWVVQWAVKPSSTPASVSAATTLNPVAYVNPFIGTAPGGSHFGTVGNGGNTFPGATYPMGMLQWSPDTISRLPGGYSYGDHTIKGFSLTHFSGRGCMAYQDVPLMPYVGTVTDSPALNGTLYNSTFSHSSEVAQAGYYKVQLDKNNIKAELTVAALTGMGRFTYPASSSSTMLINAGGSAIRNTAASVTINPAANEVSGSSTSTVGCGSRHYTLYFVAQFDHTFTRWGTWNDKTVQAGSKDSQDARSGAYVTFGTNYVPVLHVRVGISYVSIANARANLVAQHPGFDFNAMRAAASQAWRQQLGAIAIHGGSSDEMTTFYTALYHVLIHPNRFNDANGQYLGFDGQVHTVSGGHIHFENIAAWDEYRSQIRLLAIIAPDATSDIAQSLVDDALQGDGHIPRWEQTNVDSHGMRGDGGSIIISEAAAFGDTAFDTASALTAMVNGQAKVREYFQDYATLGYVPADCSESAAITQEYSNADFAIAQFAHSLGQQDIYQSMLQSSLGWRHLFNPATGYVQPRARDGSWAPNFDPALMNGFVEGNSAQYTWMEPFDLPWLFKSMGGNKTVVQRLDTFFTHVNIGPNYPEAFMGNEPSLEVPWEYDFAQAPSHTQQVVRRIQLQLFNNTPGGLPGNDDGGATSSWYVFSALGLYPEIPGVGGFVIGSPLFPSATVRLAGGHILTINGGGANDRNPYVQSLALNGNMTSHLWLPWDSVKNGATLTFTLGSQPTSWGTGASDAP
ncbi:GH92 family glycosyl hydrolase [Dictyobacter aurantiacus]|uniref:Alpha-1,2-mannosidase n=1 Tax=Dictyobacter aurantiacus TaxID=1936993 RepID=A0A401ZE15_9CHLR|nr:GH92 family glycosyl hydrolase [Dictyobacter aurantiacus]GCE05121.1 hypothetical protein KDAU_24500 [Dictyobacter aurantiacus]